MHSSSSISVLKCPHCRFIFLTVLSSHTLDITHLSAHYKPFFFSLFVSPKIASATCVIFCKSGKLKNLFSRAREYNTTFWNNCKGQSDLHIYAIFLCFICMYICKYIYKNVYAGFLASDKSNNWIVTISLQQLLRTVQLKCENMTVMDRMQLWKNAVKL